MSENSPALIEAFRGLIRSASTAESTDDVYAAVCDAAVAGIEGCQHASLLLAGRRGMTSAAASDEVARLCDELAARLGQGPGAEFEHDAGADTYLCADLETGPRWPALSEAVRMQTSVRGMACVRLRSDGRTLGALNLFSDSPGALSEVTLGHAELFAVFATITVLAESHRREAATLREGLASNRMIGTAVGLIMAAHDLSQDAAFDVLSRLSQDMNVKLAAVAAEIVAGHEKALADDISSREPHLEESSRQTSYLMDGRSRER